MVYLPILTIKFNYKEGNSLPETNMAPENQWLEDEFPFGARPIFRGENVSFREGIYHTLILWPLSATMFDMFPAFRTRHAVFLRPRSALRGGATALVPKLPMSLVKVLRRERVHHLSETTFQVGPY